MFFVDSHAHLTSPSVLPDLQGILERAEKANITTIINICTDRPSLEAALSYSSPSPKLFHTAATTPHDVDKQGEENFDYFAAHARKGKLIAIGESGLDYHYKHSSPENQKHFLIRYLHLAAECQLPIVIHCREAFEDLFQIIDTEYRNLPGILHCFTGTLAEAKEVIKRGWYLSLSGIVTFKRSEVLREVAQYVPLEQLLIETDTPYLAPQSQRGKPNEPSFLPETAAVIAAQKGLSLEEIARITSDNAWRAFNLPGSGSPIP